MAVLDVEKILVHPDSLEMMVSCEPGCRFVSPAAARCFLALLPHLGEQACVSYGHRTFSQEIEGTETQHLLEHLMIELQVVAKREREDAEPATFFGSTRPVRGSAGDVQATRGSAGDVQATRGSAGDVQATRGFAAVQTTRGSAAAHPVCGFTGGAQVARSRMIVDVTFEDDFVALAACILACKMIDRVYAETAGEKGSPMVDEEGSPMVTKEASLATRCLENLLSDPLFTPSHIASELTRERYDDSKTPA